jgi:hypothetical protein
VVLDRFHIRIDDMPGDSHFSPSALVCAPSSGRDPSLGRNPNRDPMQPAPDRLPPADCSGPTCQNQERRLSSVFGVFFTAQDLPAHPQHHRAMPVDKSSERRLGIIAPALEKPLEQLPVGEAAGCAGTKERLDLLEEAHGRPAGNACPVFTTVGLEHPV